jgi:hypothetical protein
MEAVPMRYGFPFSNFKTKAMSRLSKHHFWEWFRRHNHEYLSLHTKTKKEITYWLNELNAHLRAYNKFLGYSLHWQPGGEGSLTITVYGKARHFKKVDDLVALAPVIGNWRIHALEDPQPIDSLPEVMESGMNPTAFYFSLAGDDRQPGVLILYHPLFTPENEERLYQLAHTLVYYLLGERTFGTEIHSLVLDNLSTADPAEISRLEHLADYMGLRSSAMVIDSQGRLLHMEGGIYP